MKIKYFGLVLVVAFSFLLSSQPTHAATVDTSAIIDLTNELRAAQNLNSLQKNTALTDLASKKAEDMARNGYFSHYDQNGESIIEKVQRSNYEASSIGENIAYGYTNALAVFEGWKNSPGHYENLVRPEFTEIGVAQAVGNYRGKETTFTVMVLGTRESAAPLLSAAKIVRSMVSFGRDLEFGMETNDVLKLQETLQRLGYLDKSPTGYFGPLTKLAVQKFQAVNNLPTTGYVGPLTRSILNNLVG